jgi:hypothetical protein
MERSLKCPSWLSSSVAYSSPSLTELWQSKNRFQAGWVTLAKFGDEMVFRNHFVNFVLQKNVLCGRL